MDINDAINFVIDEVEQPALNHPRLEEKFKNKVRNSKTTTQKMKKIGDLYLYLKRFEHVVPEGDAGRDLYDRFKELNLKTYEELFPEFVGKFKYHINDMTVLDDFVIGQEYSSWDIAIFAQSYFTMPGIYLIGEEPHYQAIFIKATFEQGKYPNRWIDPTHQTLQYYMHSRKGVFKKEYKSNKAILNANQTNTPIYVFQKEETRLTLKGIFQYKSNDYDPQDESRWFILEKINSLDTDQGMTEDEYENEVFKQVGKSKNDSNQNRKERLKQANKKPGTVTVSSIQFDRNADVIAEVLERANGVCENCHQPAPFIRNDLTPYLEVHHQTPLSEGGEDTVENAIAVCPNCHKKEHFAAEIMTVVAGVIIENDKVLIAQRSGNNERNSVWELPGGKVNEGETFEKGLHRELYEELGVTTNIQKFFGENVYQDDFNTYRLMTYISKRIMGDYKSNVHNKLKFVAFNELDSYNFLPADVPIVEKLKNQFH